MNLVFMKICVFSYRCGAPTLRSVKTALTAKRDGLRTHTLNASHCPAVRTLLFAVILYAIHRQLCIAALEKYTLWSRFILLV